MFKSKRVVVFIDGDFWHGRALLEEGVEGLKKGLRTNKSDWWISKIQKNVVRDKTVTTTLTDQGWKVLRFWESEVKSDLSGVANNIELTLGALT